MRWSSCLVGFQVGGDSCFSHPICYTHHTSQAALFPDCMNGSVMFGSFATLFGVSLNMGGHF